MGFLIANDILSDCSYSLIQNPVFTNLGTGVAAPGIAVITPPSMYGVYVGAQLVVGVGLSTQETVTVTSVSATTFTATFANTHTANDILEGATFPLGQPDHPIFTQAEILGYLAAAQNDFLLKTRVIYTIVTLNLLPGKYFQQPAQAIRVERIAIPAIIQSLYGIGTYGSGLYGGAQTTWSALFDSTQTWLDLLQPLWTTQTMPTVPTSWFQDQANTGMVGFFPPYQAGGLAEIWFSDRGPQTLTLSSSFLVPDIFCHYLKYSVLEHCFSKDGELRDSQRALYCRKRFHLGVVIGSRFMLGAEAALKKQQAGEGEKFSPMPVPVGVSQ